MAPDVVFEVSRNGTFPILGRRFCKSLRHLASLEWIAFHQLPVCTEREVPAGVFGFLSR